MKSKYCLFLLFFLAILFNGCIAEFLLEDVGALTLDAELAGAAEGLSITTEGIMIADETILNSALRRVSIEGNELYVYTPEGTKSIGSVVGSDVIDLNGYKYTQLPGDIYRVSKNNVGVRTTLNDYKVFHHKETGQLVLRVRGMGNSQYGYFEVENNTFGFIALDSVSLVSKNRTLSSTAYQFSLCKICKGNGHYKRDVICTICNSIGKISCGYCNGKGNHPCYNCSGTGIKNCAHCSGNGEMSCPNCMGSGVISSGYGNTVTCNYCSGQRRISCTYCGGIGHSTCKYCNGAKIITCNHCIGVGTQTCYQCFGKGKLTEDLPCSQCLGSGWNRTFK